MSKFRIELKISNKNSLLLPLYIIIWTLCDSLLYKSSDLNVGGTYVADDSRGYLNNYPSKSFRENIIYDDETAVKKYNSTRNYYNNFSTFDESLPKTRHKVRKKTLVELEALELFTERSVKNEEEYPSYSDSDEDDDTVYLGYAKDPFGPSTRWDKNVRLEDAGMVPSTSKGPKESRGKRGVAHLYNMVSCATGCNPLAYKGYGCYCGFLGSGQFTDSIDRCCMIHDICYASVECPVLLVYFVPYAWRCWHGRPQCARQPGGAQTGACAARLCECDRRLALCLARSPCPTKRSYCSSSPWRLLQNLVMFY